MTKQSIRMWQINGWMNGWMDGWMDGETDAILSIYLLGDDSLRWQKKSSCITLYFLKPISQNKALECEMWLNLCCTRRKVCQICQYYKHVFFENQNQIHFSLFGLLNKSSAIYVTLVIYADPCLTWLNKKWTGNRRKYRPWKCNLITKWN